MPSRTFLLGRRPASDLQLIPTFRTSHWANGWQPQASQSPWRSTPQAFEAFCMLASCFSLVDYRVLRRCLSRQPFSRHHGNHVLRYLIARSVLFCPCVHPTRLSVELRVLARQREMVAIVRWRVSLRFHFIKTAPSHESWWWASELSHLSPSQISHRSSVNPLGRRRRVSQSTTSGKSICSAPSASH